MRRDTVDRMMSFRPRNGIREEVFLHLKRCHDDVEHRHHIQRSQEQDKRLQEGTGDDVPER